MLEVIVHGRTTTCRFNVESGPAGDRLLEFAKQADLSLLADFNAINAHHTQAVSGTLEPRDALATMLKGSGLEFRFTAPQSVVVIESGSRNRDPAYGRRLSEETQSNTEDSERREIVVSTDRVRGELEENVGGTLLTIDSDSIENTAITTPFELIRTLPQVSGAGPTEQTFIFGREARTNSALGNGVNLRRLGARATLVLVDGRPLAPGGTAGSFVDIANLPFRAIAQTQIASDYGSTRYGASAIGGIDNFVLRRTEGLDLEGIAGGHGAKSLGERAFGASYGLGWTGGGVFIS